MISPWRSSSGETVSPENTALRTVTPDRSDDAASRLMSYGPVTTVAR